MDAIAKVAAISPVVAVFLNDIAFSFQGDLHSKE